MGQLSRLAWQRLINNTAVSFSTGGTPVNTDNVVNGATSGRLLSPINEESQPAYDNKVSLEPEGRERWRLGRGFANWETRVRTKKEGANEDRDRWRPPNSKELEKLTFRLRAETSKRKIYPTRPRTPMASDARVIRRIDSDTMGNDSHLDHCLRSRNFSYVPGYNKLADV
ncbi:hypothetical protein K0M31_010906 [Melipona bicolor]|uniref:Uncharacterized protein n=1 Tax=Melipona bicolor TaxID=60889 RepID=A0AA40KHN1_9HYME|nr:hypothetical protein K0M31_010906 [Melipona bicolor]